VRSGASSARTARRFVELTIFNTQLPSHPATQLPSYPDQANR
jgi:hypothetical protein